MAVKLLDFNLYIHNIRSRMPFKYGIATMTAMPHLFIVVDVEVDGVRQQGIAADSLVPKWFTKDPDAHYEDEIKDMLAVINSAAEIARKLDPAPTVFDLWFQVYEGQKALTEYPPLLRQFGVSLIERAVIDAFCRATGTSFAQAFQANTLGINLGQIHPELQGMEPIQLLPKQPVQSINLRHTIGLADYLMDSDIPDHERLNDGLPQSLQASIDYYGLSYFKIKVNGDFEQDIDRLKHIRAVIDASGITDYQFTLDGNEQYHDVDSFKKFWEAALEQGDMANLIFVEQPLHRNAALTQATGDALNNWDERPPMIIDEADAELNSFRTALECGYIGTSHKNCKGVFKGIANACLVAYLCQQNPGQEYIMSGEDLINVGPVALLQDLTVMAVLGLEHVERNGHHYFPGLNMFPPEIQEAIQDRHADLYQMMHGFPALHVNQGRIQLSSLLESPFGVGIDLDPAEVFMPVNKWTYETLEE